MYSAASSIHEAAWRGDAREVVGQVVADPSLLYARSVVRTANSSQPVIPV